MFFFYYNKCVLTDFCTQITLSIFQYWFAITHVNLYWDFWKIWTWKCQCIRIGPIYDLDCAQIIINNTPVQWVQEMKILWVGLLIKNQSFIAAWIQSLVECRGVATAVLCWHWLTQIGVPVQIHSIVSTGISAVELRTMSHAYDNVYADIFNSWNQDTIALCQYYIELLFT